MSTEITRIRVGEFAFGRPSNAYLLRNGPEAVLIDTGVGNQGGFENLRDGFAELDVGLEDLTHVLLTHWHADHAGLSGRLQAATGVPVHIHEADAPMVQRDEPIYDELSERQLDLMATWGVPKPKRDAVVELLDDPTQIHGRPADVEPFGADRTFEFGPLRIESRETPGHTAGHSTYLLRDGSDTVAFVGDTMLPELTPNIGGSDIRMNRPLRQYRTTLRRLQEIDPTTAEPGHKNTIRQPAERCGEILRHHEDRERSILEVVRAAGETTVWDISTTLFDDLDGIEVFNATGEVSAHLEELEANGEIDRGDGRVVAR